MSSPILTTHHLPIDEVLPELIDALNQHHEAVLQAEPGAGKTTRVPLGLLNQKETPWLQGQRILMLEPRRLAARNAAAFMAKQLGEEVGQTVGYKIRFENKVSADTRIEVVTEGILTRYLQNDPSLEGIGLIIFDEFHERSLDADLGLALALQGRRLFRNPGEGAPPLKLLVMSATLDNSRIADLISDTKQPAPIIQSQGRQYPVDILYKPVPTSKYTNNRYKDKNNDLIAHLVNITHEILHSDEGSILVFLPGQKEIRQAQKSLTERIDEQTTVITPLYGDLNIQEQLKAIAPAIPGRRKIVLATAIAESSLTIEGITVVIDSGLCRAPMFDAATGMTRLHTTRVSKAASVQRAGRAGRLQPGKCYRLWPESHQQQLIDFDSPEILQADLAPLALQLIHWGIDNPNDLVWLDSPPKAAFQQALDLLTKLGAITPNQQAEATSFGITSHGEDMAQLPAHPRIAHMLLTAAEIEKKQHAPETKHIGIIDLACHIATILNERDPLGEERNNIGADIRYRLDFLYGTDQHINRHKHALRQKMQQQVNQFQRSVKKLRHTYNPSTNPSTDLMNIDQQKWTGFLIANAYPDRIGKRRHMEKSTANAANTSENIFATSGGRSATLRSPDTLEQCDYIAIAQLSGNINTGYNTFINNTFINNTFINNADQIFLAAYLDERLFENALAFMTKTQKHTSWDTQTERFVGEQQLCIGKLVLSQAKLTHISAEEHAPIILDLVRKRGLQLLPWTDTLRQWQARILLLRSTELTYNLQSAWPDLSDANLLNTLDEWLAPYVQNIRHIHDFQKLDLSAILHNLLPWPLPQQLNNQAPTHFTVPSGSLLPIDYTQSPPVLAVRLQEMFGSIKTPTIAHGKIPLLLHLLSPARRPLQITQDIASFWQNTYTDVKKDMKGRYPKHYWPENPLEALPTAKAKPRSH